jgi:hypothetical protein
MTGAIYVQPNPRLARELRTTLNSDFFDSLRTVAGILKENGNGSAFNESFIDGLTGQEKLSGYAHIAYHKCVELLELDNFVDAARSFALINDTLICEPAPRLVGFKCGDYEQEYDQAYFDVSNKSFRITYGMDLDIAQPSEDELHAARSATRTALNWLAICDPELLDEMQIYMTDILLMQSNTINAASSVRSYGIVRMSHLKEGQSWTRYYENLVHEAAHQHLNYLWHQDEIILNEDSGTYSSPLRREPRPLSGIFHAAFVLARTMRGLRSLQNSAEYDPEKFPVVTGYNNKKNPAGFKEKFNDCIVTLDKHAEFTVLGQQLYDELKTFAIQNDNDAWFKKITITTATAAE